MEVCYGEKLAGDTAADVKCHRLIQQTGAWNMNNGRQVRAVTVLRAEAM